MTKGGSLPRTRVAFGDPNEAGIQLAVNYIGDQENGRYIIYESEHYKQQKDIVTHFSKKFRASC